MQMKTASVISTALHIAVLGWATLSFNGKAFESTHVEAMPIDLVNISEFSQMTKGVKDAPKVENQPKPVVEKVSKEPPPTPADDLKPKITEKREVADNKEAAPPQPESKPEPPKPEPKPEPQKAEPKPDQIADKIKDDKEPTAKAESQPLPPKRPPMPKKPQQQFNPNQIAALLDKRDPLRHAQTGDALNSLASKGTSTGSSSTLSASELSMFMAKIKGCWDVPAGIADANSVPVLPITIQLNRDGSLASQPRIDIQVPPGPMQIVAESALRAILKCAPYTMFRQSNYEAWRILPLGFDPGFMSRS